MLAQWGTSGIDTAANRSSSAKAVVAATSAREGRLRAGSLRSFTTVTAASTATAGARNNCRTLSPCQRPGLADHSRGEDEQAGAHDHGHQAPTIQSQACLGGARGTENRMQHTIILEASWSQVRALIVEEDS